MVWPFLLDRREPPMSKLIHCPIRCLIPIRHLSSTPPTPIDNRMRYARRKDGNDRRERELARPSTASRTPSPVLNGRLVVAYLPRSAKTLSPSTCLPPVQN